jgi:hypothetical protein
VKVESHGSADSGVLGIEEVRNEAKPLLQLDQDDQAGL